MTFSNRGEPSPDAEHPQSGESVRLIWPGANGATNESAQAAAQAPAESAAEFPAEFPAESAAADGAVSEATGAAEDQGDLPFWDWSPDQTELDDPSDALAPDRPEDPDGPDYPDYRALRNTGAAPVTPAPAETEVPRAGWRSRGTDPDKGLRRPREPAVAAVSAQADEPRREGIGQHLGNLAHLSADPRMRAWQWRAAIAIVIIVGFAVWGPWLWGLTIAVLAVIADTIIRSRRTMLGPAGVRQNAAQRQTRRQLGRLERAGYRAEHNVPIPGSDDQIDHLVIGPAGVFAIDSAGWDKRLPVRAKSGTQLWHGPFSMKDRLDHARWEAEQAATRLSGALGTQVTVRPAMAVYGPKLHWDVATIRDVDVLRGPKLRRYLRRVARQGDTRLLSDGEIERIDTAAQAAFPQTAARRR